jgi:hypothetical protein
MELCGGTRYGSRLGTEQLSRCTTSSMRAITSQRASDVDMTAKESKQQRQYSMWSSRTEELAQAPITDYPALSVVWRAG